jgi:hypothetical protein
MYSVAHGLAEKQKQPERVEKAARKIAELRPKLATLAVEVPADVAALPGLVVTRDWVALGEAQWGTAVPVDKGEYRVVAKADGRRAFHANVAVDADGKAFKVKVVMELAPAPEAAGRAWQMPLGATALAAGGVGLALGAVFGGLAIGKKDESGAHCTPGTDFCDPDGIRIRDEGLTFAGASTGLFIAGGILAAGGIVLVATAPRAKAAPKPDVTLRVMPAGFAIGGRF